MDRKHLAHGEAGAINVMLAATGYSFRRMLAWLAHLLSAIGGILFTAKLNAEPALET